MLLWAAMNRVQAPAAPIYNVIVGTAGHIDHGKSSLVRALTGVDPDRLPEEQARGLTIDLGFAPLMLETGERVGIIDVPGHERFVKNMVAGATSIDVVLLVVACNDGVMPQTREHLQILTLLGIGRGMIVLTKTDLVEPGMVDLVREEAQALVRGTFLEEAPVLPVSVATGEGMDRMKSALAEIIRATPRRNARGPFRMPIQRVFSAKGFGTIVTGVPVSGSARPGDPLEILPPGRIGRVRGLQAYHATVEEVRAGHSSAINLADVDHEQVRRGFVAATPGFFRGVRFLEARLRYLKEAGRPLKHLAPIRLHLGTEEAVGRVALLGRKSLDAGSEAFVQFRLAEPVAAAVGDPFIVRLQSPLVTLGGGRVLGTSDARTGRDVAAMLDRLERTERALGDPAGLAEEALRQAGTDPAGLPILAAFAGLSLAEAERTAAELVRQGKAVTTGAPDRFLHREGVEAASRRVLAGLEEFHREQPLRLGIDPPSLRVMAEVIAEVFDAALKALRREGRVAEEGGLLRLASFRPALAPEAARRLGEIETALRDARFATPRREELEANLRIPRSDLDRLLNLLKEQGKITILKDDVLLHAGAMEEAKRILLETLQAQGEVESAKFRDRLGTTRKYVIPLLEHFDQIGLTVRDGNRRFLKKKN